ncbi:hypothetical protein EVAR_41278_1 [Eumeta japonica]|uniref:Uncharacterized protein n=1 Tax=Eumeta variegata TaxID=151549 RepID=A0A4C1X867_EUMVA|nr:hypothetical protein EVAR_41278_1 [Eumeta japonica]
MLGPGLWIVRNMEMCPENDQYESPLEIIRKKINRTHDGFTAEYQLATDINTEAALDVTVFKQVDGGWKIFHSVVWENACEFFKKNSKENFSKILTAADQPDECPLVAGHYKIENFIFNYEDLPEQCVYGMFKVLAYLKVEGRKVTCLTMYAECLEKVPGTKVWKAFM